MLSPGMVRRLRLWSGFVLFAYVTCHLVNHAFGIRSIEAMQAAGDILLDPWQTLPGLTLLYGALLLHAGLGLRAFWRRRHLRIPLLEKTQLLLGLAIPLLLLGHAATVRYAETVYDLPIGFDRVIYQLWVVSPAVGAPKQLLLMLVVWLHGCIGMRGWLRTRPWYEGAVPALTALATVVPLLAVIGFVNAGLDMRDYARANPALLPTHVIDVGGTEQALQFADVGRVVDRLTLGYIMLLGGIAALRAARDWHATRFRALRITYPAGRVVTVPIGFSVLEASRWAGIPHASVCGGRGRCSTCRVDVIAGGEDLPPPASAEQKLLSSIGAPASVRLACQIRPERDIAVLPLVHADTIGLAGQGGIGLPSGGRRETRVAALFVDLRQSTRLSDDRLPYDALFIVERYIKVVSTAVRDWDGHVTNIAGDGIMSVFGTGGSSEGAARDAFRAAEALWRGLDALNLELGRELSEPLRFGIGLHLGVAVVGLRWDGGMEGMPFLGDTGNVAARLESETKRLDSILVASREAVLMVAGGDRLPAFEPVMLAGKQEATMVATFSAREDLQHLLGLVEEA